MKAKLKNAEDLKTNQLKNITDKADNMEKIEIENKAEKAPKVTKKQKEFVSEETIVMFEEILKDYAIDLKYRPFIKQLVNEYRKNG